MDSGLEEAVPILNPFCMFFFEKKTSLHPESVPNIRVIHLFEGQEHLENKEVPKFTLCETNAPAAHHCPPLSEDPLSFLKGLVSLMLSAKLHQNDSTCLPKKFRKGQKDDVTK